MNPNEHQHHPSRSEAPAPEPSRPDRVPAGAPEAIAAADVDREHRLDPADTRARGVDWVRTSDLLARGRAAAAPLASDFDAHLAHKAHDPLARGVKHVAAKARELPPLSASGRRGGREGAERGPVGMS
jgi:hypothetical protein